MAMKNKYYSLKNILSKNARYNIIIGERSNGKTYACLHHAIEQYIKDKKQTALVRRWQDDFVGKRGSVMFDSLTYNGEVDRMTKGEWTGVYYFASKWYLCRYEQGNRVTDETPFCYGFAISSMEHDKSTSYPNIEIIIFDEFITRGAYLPDEFVLFMNVCSTIIRERMNVTIFMLGNTVNRYCPYFNEMGLENVKNMKQGTIDVYTYGQTELRVAVEYCDTLNKTKQSNVYFAFDNPKLQMITGGTWEIDLYPHAPCKWSDKHIIFSYFIEFDNETLQADIIGKDNMLFTFIHRKTTPIKNPEHDIIYSSRYDPRPNWFRNILRPTSNIEQKITRFYKTDSVYYQDNEVGEIVRNYLQWCRGLI